MKISIPCLRLSSSGVTDTRVKMFHISLSDTQKGPQIAWAAWCCHLKTARERVKEATISTTNFAWCIELITGIDSSYLKWSQEKKYGILWYQISKFFLNRWKVFQKKKKNDHGNYFFWLISAIKAIISSSYKKKKGNYFIWLKNHYKLRNAMFTVFLQHIYNKL